MTGRTPECFCFLVLLVIRFSNVKSSVDQVNKLCTKGDPPEQIQPTFELKGKRAHAALRLGHIKNIPSWRFADNKEVCCGFKTQAQETSAYLPYQFQYSIDHPEGGQSSRVEKGDRGAVTGSYQITTVDGFKRVVNYVADGSGFRAFVDSNEPGVKSGEYPAPDNNGKEFIPDRYKPNSIPASSVAPSPSAPQLPILGYRKIEHVHETPLYQEVPERTPGQPFYQEFIPQEFSPLRPLHVVTNGHAGPSFSQRRSRKLESHVEAISPILTLKPDPRGERGLPQQEQVSEQVAHSPTLYFNTPNKEEEGGAIITKNNLNPPVRIFPPGSGIAQQGRPFQPSVPQIQTHHPKNYPVQNPSELLSVDVQPVNKRLGDLLPDIEDVHHPYEFKFSSGLHGHRQSGDSTGKVKGEYYLRGHDGQLRKVVYEADKNGFRARVDTNEFGIISHKPNNATITRTGKLPQFQTLANPQAPENVFKPERPLERPPRPSIYVGQDLLINTGNGRFADQGAPRQPQRTSLPAATAGGDVRFDQPGKFEPHITAAKPIETFTDLKQRPENFDVVEPLPPHSGQRVHPASRLRQTFVPINTLEQTPGGQGNQAPLAPNTRTRLEGQLPEQDRLSEVQPLGVLPGRPNLYSQVPPSRDSRYDSLLGTRDTEQQDDRSSGNAPVSPSVLFRQPNSVIQRNEYRQPHHGPGFGYQFSTSHEQDVDPPPSRFYRLENPRLPPLPPTPKDGPSNPPRPPSPGFNFNFGTQVVTTGNERVPSQGGNGLSPRPPASQRDSRRGRLIEPALVIEENDSDPQNRSPDSFDGTYKPLRRDPPRGRIVPPLARSFGRPASPNLKTPASEALKSDLGANVSPAPIKQFGPPAATPLPSKFQSAANRTEAHHTTATPFTSEDSPATISPNAARTGKSSPLLRMYDNGVVIGGPEPQKISYDPINDNPARQGRNSNDERQHSGYAPRNFGPVYYNSGDRINHYSNFAETSEPNRNARLIHETVTHQVEVPKVGQAPTTSTPSGFSPADGANLMSFGVRKVSRRRRRKQRPSESAIESTTTETPEPELISRSSPIPSPRPRLPHQRINSPLASNTKQPGSRYNDGIPFGARLRPQQNSLPRPRDIMINPPRSTTMTTTSPDSESSKSPSSTEAPPLRKIVRRRRLKNRVQNNEDAYPNIPRTPAPADFGFHQGVPRVSDSHGRLPHLPTGAEVSARRRPKNLSSTIAATTPPTTTAHPDDSTVDLKQSTTQKSSDPPPPDFSTSKAHLPGLPPPPPDSPNVSLVSLIDQPPPVFQTQKTSSRYRSQEGSHDADNESKLYHERREDRPPEKRESHSPREAKQLSIPHLLPNNKSTGFVEHPLSTPHSILSPYKFGFDDRHDGGRIARHEEFDGSGRVTGFYTIEDPDGRRRLVKYIADENGFRAQVLTNEQGTDNQDPAQIKVYSTSPHYVPQKIDFRGASLGA